MNRKGSEVWIDAVIYIILLAFFSAGLMLLIGMQQNGAGIWSKYYASEIVKVVNGAEPGDAINLNVHRATEIALKNKVMNDNEIFTFRGNTHEVCVKLSSGKKSCIYYFNDVLITDVKLERGVPGNVLSFNVRKFGETKNE